MKLRQPTTKRKIYYVDSDQDDSPSESEEGEIAETKRRKQETNPLNMESMVEKIFSYLDVESLKNAREVCPLWRAEGAKMLLAQCHVRIPSKLLNSESLMRYTHEVKFRNFLSNKSIIPKIIVGATGDVKLWKSLGVLGPLVKSLKLEFIGEKPEFFSDLLDLLPNLKYLSFRSMARLMFATKQGNIFRVLASKMSTAERGGNPLIISFLPLEPVKSLGELEDIEMFAKCDNIIVEELEASMGSSVAYSIPQFHTRVGNFVTKLLSTSQDTLKNLSLINCEESLSVVEFSSMTQLTDFHLTFRLPNTQTRCKFSSAFKFTENTPNLQNMSICSELQQYVRNASYRNLLATVFANIGNTAPSVKCLKFSDDYLDLYIDHLFEIFPNIEAFHASKVRCNQTMFKSLWGNGKSLKKLYLTVKMSGNVEKIADLDFCFTGFTKKTVDWIRDVPKGFSFGITNAELSRVNPSILDLKGLKEFTIVFDGTGSRKYLPTSTLAFAAEYAFKLMANDSRVVIRFKDCGSIQRTKEALSEVSKLSNVVVKWGA